MIGVGHSRWVLKSGKLSRIHLTTYAYRRTLCGLKVPQKRAHRLTPMVHMSQICKTCRRVEENMIIEYGEAVAEVEAGKDKYDA